jgi:alginate O-acetyltransferase complex protein AlgI
VTFDLTTIAVFAIGAIAYSILLPSWLRGWALMVASVLVIYWLQPVLNIRRIDFVLPTATIALTVAGWWFTRKPDDEEQAATLREDRITFGLIFAMVVGVAALRYLEPQYRLTSRPPDPLYVGLALLIVVAVVGPGWMLLRRRLGNTLLTAAILLIVAIFAIIKTEPLTVEFARFLRDQTGMLTRLASAGDIEWIGFSYVAFRLIHTFRDRQSGKLPALSLREYLTYAIFFPAFTAGPIDRAERFVKDYRALPDLRGLAAPRYTEGAARIATGIFKKFVIADTLALGMALNATNAAQADSALFTWVLLYGYALRLFFDFSGYSDIAIGIGILFGIKLPENFDRPYTRNNLAAFWQSWHITLSNWARFYVFSPVSRFMLTRKRKPSPVVVVLVCQTATMVTIGLWHGVTLNFVIWGLWHGAGLFVHKLWSDRTRKWFISLRDKPDQKRAWTAAGWFITFHYVTLGWVWFALPEVSQSVDVFGKLIGIGL